MSIAGMPEQELLYTVQPSGLVVNSDLTMKELGSDSEQSMNDHPSLHAHEPSIWQYPLTQALH
jgi:hypothetical protein